MSVKNAAWHIKHAQIDPTLLMGSSRSSGFYGPKFASQLGTSLVKLDLPGSTLAEHRYNLEGILQEGARPKHVIIALDDFSLYYKAGYSNRVLFPTTFLSRSQFLVDWLFDVPSVNGIITSLNYKGVYQRVGFGELFEPEINQEFISIKRGLDVPAMEASQFSPEDYKFFIEDNLEFVKDILALSIENEFKLTFIFTPRWVKASYRRDHQKIFEFKQKLAELHSFYDFSGVAAYTVDASYWADSSHFDTNLGVIAGEIIMREQGGNNIFGRLVNADNIVNHLEELKDNLKTNLLPMINKFPDMEISSVLESYLQPSYVRVALPSKYINKQSEEQYVVSSGFFENSELITFKFGLSDYTVPVDPKDTINKKIIWNDILLGVVKFGVANRYSLSKQWSIDYGNREDYVDNVLTFQGEEGRVEFESIYLTFDVLKLERDENLIYLDDELSIYQVDSVILLKFNECASSDHTYYERIYNMPQIRKLGISKLSSDKVELHTFNNYCYTVHIK
ncbi:hypothetical protein RJD40_00895 [Vibrio scophthalmi]|uniref:hypothetical protein n=1 Tax=Vibrio scophthalmi TaxID=45658 RepID=UPI003AAF52EE